MRVRRCLDTRRPTGRVARVGDGGGCTGTCTRLTWTWARGGVDDDTDDGALGASEARLVVGSYWTSSNTSAAASSAASNPQPAHDAASTAHSPPASQNAQLALRRRAPPRTRALSAPVSSRLPSCRARSRDPHDIAAIPRPGRNHAPRRRPALPCTAIRPLHGRQHRQLRQHRQHLRPRH